MFNKIFLMDTLERMVKSAAQAVLLFLGADLTDVFAVSWSGFLGAAGAGALLSVLTSIISAGVGSTHSASMVAEVNQAVEEHEVRH